MVSWTQVIIVEVQRNWNTLCITEYIMEAEPTELADELDVGCECVGKRSI